MAHDFYTNDGEKHEGISSVKLPADSGGVETVEFIADNEVTKNSKIQQTKSVTLTASGTVNPDAGYEAVRSVAVTVQGGSDPVPVSISVSAAGVVTASGAGIVTGTHQLSASDDADFVASNIKSGVTIFGVTGSYNPPAGNVTMTASIESPTYQSGTALTDVKSDITAVLHFPNDAEIDIEDTSTLSIENLTTGGETIETGSNILRVGFGGIYTNISVTGLQSEETYTITLNRGTDYNGGGTSTGTININGEIGMTNDPSHVVVENITPVEVDPMLFSESFGKVIFEKQNGAWVCVWLSNIGLNVNVVNLTIYDRKPTLTIDKQAVKITSLGGCSSPGQYIIGDFRFAPSGTDPADFGETVYQLTVSDTIPDEVTA